MQFLTKFWNKSLNLLSLLYLVLDFVQTLCIQSDIFNRIRIQLNRNMIINNNLIQQNLTLVSNL